MNADDRFDESKMEPGAVPGQNRAEVVDQRQLGIIKT
jgi:hypothetical protein